MSTPSPEPQPQPQPQPVPPPKRILTVPLAILLGCLFIGLCIFFKPGSGGSPVSPRDASAAGKAYGQALCETYASSLDQAGNAIGTTGQSMSKAQEDMQASWTKARTAAFNQHVTPIFSAILPEGSEPSSQAQRDQLANAFHQVAQGVRDASRAGINWMGR